MVVLIFVKNKENEDGFSFIESLLTLLIVMTIITLVFPLLINWLQHHLEASKFIEENRYLYEFSLNEGIDHSSPEGNGKYTVEVNRKSIQIKETRTGVFIYESSLEE